MAPTKSAFALLLLLASCDALRPATHLRTTPDASTRRAAPALSLQGEAATLRTRSTMLTATKAVDDAIPGRSVVTKASISFIFASTLLLAEFIAIACGAFSIVNYLGAASCVGWVVAFVFLINWIVFSTFPVWGPDKRALTGAIIKLVASCFFNIQPWSWILAPGYGVPGIGVPWSNFVGAWMFHIGNSIDSIGMAPMFDKAAPLSLANFPILGMWILTAASTFLSIAGTVSFYKSPASLLAYVVPSQIVGAFLLLVGSVMYTYWSCKA